jgi:hypothetical protein
MTRRSTETLKKLWRTCHDKLDKAMLRAGTCSDSEMHIIDADIRALKKEQISIEEEMYGDWAPKSVKDEEA